MKAQKLGQKIKSIKAASDYQHRLIDNIYQIMVFKRKAQQDYKTSLQAVHKELQKYIVKENGFLNEIVKAFQSYINVVHQNQSSLIDGYDNQILNFLIKAKQSTLEESILKKVQFVDKKVEECRDKIKHYKKLIKQNSDDLQIISSQVAFKSKLQPMQETERKKFAEKYQDLVQLKKINQDNLQQHIDGMMDLTMLHSQTIQELDQYQQIYLEQKANDVFDNFMRAFVLQVSFIRNMQFDVTTILQKVNDKKQEYRKISIAALNKQMQKEKGLKQSIWDTYKKWTQSENGIDIRQAYINTRLRDKWKRVCQYYNEAF